MDIVPLLQDLSKEPSFWVAIALTTFTYLAWYYRHNAIGCHAHLSASIRRIDGHIPILGCVVQNLVNFDRILDLFSDVMNDNQNIKAVASLPFSPPYLVVNDPQSIEYVTKTNFENYVKGYYWDQRFKDVLGHGIFNSDGDAWRKQRKLASNIFNTRIFKSLFETVFAQEMTVFSDILSTHAKNETAFDIQDLFFRFTLDSFAIIGFGVDLKSLQKGKVPFATAFDRAQTKVIYRFFSPFWWIEERLNLFGYFEHLRDIKTIREFGSKMIQDRRAEDESVRAERRDLLSLFMATTDDKGEPLSDTELIDHVLNFIIAGRDTTAQALSWCMYCLHQHPDKAEKLYKEIDETLGDSLVPTYEQAKNMKYALAVFHETLRLYPSVPGENKIAVKDDVLPDGTPIPANSAVVWFNYGMGRNKTIWGDDATTFRPERWIEFETNPSQFEYTVFNCGPRICLGRNLAELEGVFVLVSILRKYRVEIVEPEKVHYAISLTLPIKNGLYCNVHPRI